MEIKNEVQRKSLERGFTLVELMVSLVIATILIVGIYQLYRSTQNTYLAQDQLAELQQNARIGIEEMIREMRLAGYQANCTTTQADSTTSSNPQHVFFEFDADTDLNGTPERIKYWYDSNAKQINRASHSPAPVSTSCGIPYAFATNEMQVVAGTPQSPVDSLTFTFYDTNNGTLAVPVASPKDIRRVAITLAVAATKAEEGTGAKRTVTITSDVKLRNQGLKGGGGCSLPSAPSGLVASDPKICGRAKLTWTANASSESVNNYRVYWRPAGTSIWTNTADLGIVTSYILSGLANNSSYDFALAAQNSCAVGPLSSTSTTALNDNIAPLVPTGADATASTSGPLQVNLAWTATKTQDGSGNLYDATSANYDVASYKVYRTTYGSSFGSTPLATVNVPATTYIDNAGLIKCTIYDYKVTAVDQCGNESAIASSSAVYGDANLSGGITDSPTNNVTNTRPSDAIAPAAPTAFTAVAGGAAAGVTGCPNGTTNQCYHVDLSWITPNDPNFAGTQIRYNSSSSACTAANYPSSSTSGTLLADQPSQPNTSVSRGDNVYANNTYYCFTAFSKDSCPNYSAGTQSTAQAKTCGDSPVGPPPAIDTNSLKLDSQCDATGENRGTANLTWTYAHSQVDIPDLVGFNVYRTPSNNAFNKSKVVGTDTYYLINPSPVFFPSAFIPVYRDNDSTNPLNPGVTYKYIVTVVDCIGNESAPSQVLTVQPGKVDKDTTVNVTLSGTKSKQYNIVNFAFKNTSASTMTIRANTDTAVVTWTKTTARFTNFVLDGVTLWQDPTIIPPSQPTTCTASSCSTTVTFTTGYTFAALTSGKTVTLNFRNTDGTTSVDMRGQTITIQPYYRNDTAYASNSAIPACFNNPAITISTALGATVSSTTQNPPTDANGAAVPAKKNGDSGVPPGYSVDATKVVTITSQATPQQGTSISSVKIYYFADSAFLSAAPDPASVIYSSVTMGCVSGLPPNCNANQWTGPIPATPGKRIWFYVEAVDNKGNFSDDPSNATTSVFTAFTYDQPATITVRFTASFVNPSSGDKHVLVQGTAQDQGGSPVPGASVTFTIGSDVLTGTTDASGNFSATSTTNFTSGDVLVKVDATKLPGYLPGTCSKTLSGSSTSVSCP